MRYLLNSPVRHSVVMILKSWDEESIGSRLSCSMNNWLKAYRDIDDQKPELRGLPPVYSNHPAVARMKPVDPENICANAGSVCANRVSVRRRGRAAARPAAAMAAADPRCGGVRGGRAGSSSLLMVASSLAEGSAGKPWLKCQKDHNKRWG